MCVSWHDWCVYSTIDGDGFLDAMFVSGDGVEVYADDVKRPCAGR